MKFKAAGCPLILVKFKIPKVYQDFIEQKLKDLRRQLAALKSQMRN
jgi:hypothetical protein